MCLSSMGNQIVLETGIENTELRVGDLAKGVYWVMVKTPNMAVPFRKANKFVKQ
jgi:hypothetical protein